MAEAAYVRCLLLPPAAKNSRAGHVCHFAQLRAKRVRCAASCRHWPSSVTWGIMTDVTPRVAAALPPGIRNLSPSAISQSSFLATRRCPGYLARSRPVHLSRSKTTEFRAADVASDGDRPIARRDRSFEITNASGGNGREKERERRDCSRTSDSLDRDSCEFVPAKRDWRMFCRVVVKWKCVALRDEEISDLRPVFIDRFYF